MPELIAYTNDGKPVKEGDIVTDFRGEKWVFNGATRAKDSFRSGKVVCTSKDGWRDEYYDKVFNLEVKVVPDKITSKNSKSKKDNYSVIYDGYSIYDAQTLKEASRVADKSASYMFSSDYQDPWSDHRIVRNSDGKMFDNAGRPIEKKTKRSPAKKKASPKAKKR